MVPSLPALFVALPLQLLLALVILELSLPASLRLFGEALDPRRRLAPARLSMAEESDNSQKTEAPSQRRLEEARAKGQLVVSREVATLLLFGTATLLAMTAAPGVARSVAAVGRSLLAGAHLVRDGRPRPDPARSGALGRARLAAAPAVPGACSPRRWRRPSCRTRWSGPPSPCSPSSSGSRPLAGAKRLFSARSLVELGKSLLKLALVAAALAWLLWPELPRRGREPAASRRGRCSPTWATSSPAR